MKLGHGTSSTGVKMETSYKQIIQGLPTDEDFSCIDFSKVKRGDQKGRRIKINGVQHKSLASAHRDTGISIYHLNKFSENGVFNRAKYRLWCKLSGKSPKI